MVSENSAMRFVQPSRRDEHRTEVIVRLGKTRLHPGGFPVLLDRLVNPTQFPQRAPEAVMHFAAVAFARLKTKRGRVVADGLIDAPLLFGDDAKVVVGLGVAGKKADRFAVFLLGVREPAHPLIRDAQVVVRFRIVGKEANRLLHERRGLRADLGPVGAKKLEAAEIVVGHPGPRVPGDRLPVERLGIDVEVTLPPCQRAEPECDQDDAGSHHVRLRREQTAAKRRQARRRSAASIGMLARY